MERKRHACLHQEKLESGDWKIHGKKNFALIKSPNGLDGLTSIPFKRNLLCTPAGAPLDLNI